MSPESEHWLVHRGENYCHVYRAVNVRLGGQLLI